MKKNKALVDDSKPRAGSFYQEHLSPAPPSNEIGGFMKIGGDLNEDSDPRRLRGGLLSSGLRIKNLQWIDGQIWHYSIMFIMFLDFFIEFLALSFSSERNFKDTFDSISLAASSIALAVYLIDMSIRIAGLQLALLRSNSTVADLCATILLIGLVATRHAFPEIGFTIAFVHIIVVTLRLILKPRARSFSKKLHKFGREGTSIRVPMASVRTALRRIPGISAVAVEMMETDLVIICGRDEGDMMSDELMQFLERALLYRPRELSATEFLAYLQDIDAQAIRHAYSSTDVIRSTLWHWSSQRMDLILSIIVVCLNATIIPIQSYLIGFVADNALLETTNRDDLVTGAMGILLLSIPFFMANYGIGYFQSKMISKATERMQYILLDTILKQDTDFFALRSEGDLNNLFSSDIARVNALWQSVFWNLLNPLVSVVFGFGFIVLNDWPTGVLAFAYTAALLSSGPQGVASQKSKDFGSKNAYVTAEFQNAISCQKVIRSYCIRIPFMERFSVSISKLRDSSFSKDFWASFVQIYVESAMYAFVAVETAALLFKTFDGEISVGTFFAFLTMLSRLSTPVATLGGFMRVAIGNSSSLQRLDDIIIGLAKKSDDEDALSLTKLPKLPRLTKQVQFKNIFFRYDRSSDMFNLNNVSTIMPKGSYTCIVGPSGSGKSTLLGCLMQFYEPESGAILVDNLDVNNFTQESFMNQIAVVFQDISILNGTVLENIRYGNIHATDQECMEAAALAECAFIPNLKFGFNTVVGQHATTSLSGGQAQRICLARAIVRKPRLLLLDEATSALDPETEASVLSTLERLATKIDTTIVSVTHRLGATTNANMIIVMNMGSIVEVGTYDDLKEKQGSFFSEMLNAKQSKRVRLVLPNQERKSSLPHQLSPTPELSNVVTPAAAPTKELLENFTKRLHGRAISGSGDCGTPRFRGSMFGSFRQSRTSRNSHDEEIQRVVGRRSINMSLNASLHRDSTINSNASNWSFCYRDSASSASSRSSMRKADDDADRESVAVSDSDNYLVL